MEIELIISIDQFGDQKRIARVIVEDISPEEFRPFVDGFGETEHYIPLMIASGWPGNSKLMVTGRIIPTQRKATVHTDYCPQDDVFIGWGGVGVVVQPEGRDNEWLTSHCWLCGRARDEIAASVAAGGR